MPADKDELALLTGPNIKRLRRQQGLTQEKLAALYGREKNFIAQLETGQKIAGKSVRHKLALIFQCSPEEFLQPLHIAEPAAPYDHAPAGPLDTGLVSRVVEIVEEYLQEHHFHISPSRKGHLVAKLVEHCLLDREKPSPSLVRAYLRLV